MNKNLVLKSNSDLQLDKFRKLIISISDKVKKKWSQNN
jgi:hypothetical protein